MILDIARPFHGGDTPLIMWLRRSLTQWIIYRIGEREDAMATSRFLYSTRGK